MGPFRIVHSLVVVLSLITIAMWGCSSGQSSPPPDAGFDAGQDAPQDAGEDAGLDAGQDAGQDGGNRSTCDLPLQSGCGGLVCSDFRSDCYEHGEDPQCAPLCAATRCCECVEGAWLEASVDCAYHDGGPTDVDGGPTDTDAGLCGELPSNCGGYDCDAFPADCYLHIDWPACQPLCLSTRCCFCDTARATWQEVAIDCQGPPSDGGL